jgi:hypothetical protein
MASDAAQAESQNKTDPKRKVRVGPDANWAGILPHPILLVNMYRSSGYLVGIVDATRSCTQISISFD